MTIAEKTRSVLQKLDFLYMAHAKKVLQLSCLINDLIFVVAIGGTCIFVKHGRLALDNN